MSLLERLEGIEIRELSFIEVETLYRTIYSNYKVDYISKKDPTLPHDSIWLPTSIAVAHKQQR